MSKPASSSKESSPEMSHDPLDHIQNSVTTTPNDQDNQSIELLNDPLHTENPSNPENPSYPHEGGNSLALKPNVTSSKSHETNATSSTPCEMIDDEPISQDKTPNSGKSTHKNRNSPSPNRMSPKNVILALEASNELGKIQSTPSSPKNDSTIKNQPNSHSIDAQKNPNPPHSTLTRSHPIQPPLPEIANSTLGLDQFPPLIPSTSHTKNPVAPIPTNPHPFASLFKQNRLPTECEPLNVETKVDIIEVVEEHLLSVEEAWGFALVGYLVGSVPSTRSVTELTKAWGVPCRFSFHKHGWVVFIFEDRAAMDGVLEKGPYVTYGRPWIIKPVPKMFTFSDTCFSSVPIWVNLHKLPKICWSKKLLSMIGTQLGTPISMDMITSKRLLHDCARILVEVDISQEPKMMVPLRMPDGSVWEQPIQYEIEPFLCSKCHLLGHKTEACQMRRPAPPGTVR